MKIGISGGEGSFSEQAAREYCLAEGITDPELVYLTFVDAVLTALEVGEVDRGIFAIENSNGGVVTEYLPAIAAHRFSIQKIFEMEVAHALLARGGTRKEEIRIIISQNQALRQCRMYIKRMFPNAEVVEYIDTATAAKDLAAGKFEEGSAVIASRAAGERYQLSILEEGVQDLKFNYTTFIAATTI